MGNIKAFFKKILYAAGANVISLVVSLFTTFILPKFFGDSIDQYGYLQIYLFYVSYIGFFHFGLCDGIYLRDAGKKYESLDKRLYSTQFWLLMLFECIVSIVFGLIGFFTTRVANYSFIWGMIAINLIVVMPRAMLQYIMQATDRIKEYSVVTTIERALYGVLLVSLLFTSLIDFRVVVFADIASKIIALGFAVVICKDIVFARPYAVNRGLTECIINIKVGIKLLFSNIASMLVTGIVRWGIQQNWTVTTYGKISFTLSVSNFILVFISAVSIVLYPSLKRISKEKLPGIYQTIRNVLMVPLMGGLIFYYPLEQILSLWLPQYAESIKYMAILFPVCIYATKMTMLVQTYMNVYRMEKTMLKVNLLGVMVAIITTIISVFVFDNLTLAMLSIVVNQMFRCIFAEFVLSKKINIYVGKDTIFEVILTIAFILCNWFIGGWFGVAVYWIIFSIYCLCEKEKIISICFCVDHLISKIVGK